MAIKAPHPATGDSPAHDTNVFGKYVALTLSKLAPSTFRKAKKCISDVLFEFEEKDELEKANSTSFARNSTQRGFSRVDFPSSLASDLSYSDTSYASASNITPPGCNPMSMVVHICRLPNSCHDHPLVLKTLTGTKHSCRTSIRKQKIQSKKGLFSAYLIIMRNSFVPLN